MPYPAAPCPDEGGVVLCFSLLQELIDERCRHERKRRAQVTRNIRPILQPIHLHSPTRVAPQLRDTQLLVYVDSSTGWARDIDFKNQIRRRIGCQVHLPALNLAHMLNITLQRYLMKYLVKAPFPVREIGTVMTLLHACHVP